MLDSLYVKKFDVTLEVFMTRSVNPHTGKVWIRIGITEESAAKIDRHDWVFSVMPHLEKALKTYVKKTLGRSLDSKWNHGGEPCTFTVPEDKHDLFNAIPECDFIY